MQAPGFWNNPPDRPGFLGHALGPLSALYAKLTARRLSGTVPYTSRIPVICVGNLTAGGTGKTPTVIWLLQALSQTGKTVHVVSRGYGGSLAGPVRVNERDHTAGQVGDEPLLLSAFATTWVARDRAAGVRRAQEAGAQVVILDDGFQNPTVAKTFSLVVVDAAVGFGNGRVIPAGPLREPVDVGLDRADAVLAIGTEDEQAAVQQSWPALSRVPVTGARLAPLQTGMDWKDLPVMAFAGIGRPAKFFRTLKDLGANVIHAEALSDHQPLTNALLSRLSADAGRHHAQLVTTEKDAVRLPAAWRSKVLTVPVRLEVAQDEPLVSALRKAIGA